MLTLDARKIIEDFRRLANAYRESRQLRVALDLDDASIRLYSAAGHLLKNQQLSSTLHDFRQAVRAADHEQADRLHDRIEEILASLPTEDLEPVSS